MNTQLPMPGLWNPLNRTCYDDRKLWIDYGRAMQARVQELETKYSELCKDIAEWHPVDDCAQELHDLRAKLEEMSQRAASRRLQTIETEGRYLQQTLISQHYRKQSAALAEALKGLLDWLPLITACADLNCPICIARKALTTYREGR